MNDATLPAPAVIAKKLALTSDTTLFTIEAPRSMLSSSFAPGQFVQLSVPGAGEVPLSLAGAPADLPLLEFCIRRAGHVTSLLHRLDEGAVVGLRGPFGRGFPVDEMAGGDVLLLAGGLGMAPLRSLLRHIVGRRGRFGEVTLMYGAREPGLMLFRGELDAVAARGDVTVLLTVDFLRDGQDEGPRCRIGLLPSLLDAVALRPATTSVALCGPPAMYRCLLDDLLRHRFSPDRIFISLERRMKCGIGHCGHCAIGSFLCCTDGPVFRYRTIACEREAI